MHNTVLILRAARAFFPVGHNPATVNCAISKEVLEDYFNANCKNSLKVFQENREKIQQQIRRKYLLGKLESDHAILLSLKDLIS